MRTRYKKRHKRYGIYRSQIEQIISKQLPKGSKYEKTKLAYAIPKNYIVDFTVDTKKGPVFIEVKGYLRSEDQQKMRSVKLCNPGADIRFVFQKRNTVQGSKMYCDEWCEKYSFPCAIGGIPKEWFNE